MAAHQAPPSLGFSRQEHWNGLPFPSPVHESESEVAQSCPTFSDPMDCSPPDSSVHGIFQTRVLEWGAIAFSESSHEYYPNSTWIFSYSFGLCLSSYYCFYQSPFQKSLYSKHQTQVPESDQLWLLKLPKTVEWKDD